MKSFMRLHVVLLAICSWGHARGLHGRDTLIKRQHVPGAYIVELPDTQDTSDFLSSLSLKARVPRVSERVRFDSPLFRGVSFSLELADDDNEDSALSRLQALPEIRNLWPVELVPAPQLNISWTAQGKPAAEIRQRQIANGGYSPHVMTQVNKLHDKGITGKGLRIGIVDTGIDYTHPALGGCFGPGCLVEFGADLVGEGYDGSQPPNPDDDPFEDCNGHGTHVAGIIAALENPLGFIGAAPGAKIGMYRAFSCSQTTTIDALMAATSQAYEDGSDIITGSVGIASGWSQSPFALLVSRIVAAGVPCTFAAGNEVGGTEGVFGISTPSAGDGVIAVSSFQNSHLPAFDPATGVVTETLDREKGGYISPFTSWGPTFDLKLKPDVGAPGGNILSTMPLAMGGYGVESGTSMACPLLAAIVALVVEARGTRDSALIAALLSSTATPGQSYDLSTGWPVINDGWAPVPQQGAGLVQAFDAAFSQVVMDKTRLSFNDTENLITTEVFTAKNHGNTSIKYVLNHVPALTADAIWTGTIYKETTPPLTQAYAELVFDPSELILEAGAEAQVSVFVTPPRDIDVLALPIYSGWVVLNGTSEDGTESSLILPYVGAAASMRNVTVMASSRMFTTRSDDPRNPTLPDGATVQIPAPDAHQDWARDPLEATELVLPVEALPSQHIWLVMGSAEVRLEVQQITPSCSVPAPLQIDNGLGEDTLGNIAGYPLKYHRHIGWQSPWDGKLADGSWAAPGRYRFIVHALKTFGDRSAAEDWDSFYSTEFKLRYVKGQA